MENKLILLLFSILLITSVSAVDFVVTYNNNPVDYAVIGNEYLITLDSNEELTSNYADSLFFQTYQWIWTPNNQAGLRTFTIGEDTFEFNVISEVDEMLNQITNFKVFVGEENSYIETNFDLFDTTQENQFIEYQDYSANINFANLLKGLNANFNLNQGEIYPMVNSLNINSSTAITVAEALFMEEEHSFTVDDFNSNPQYYINYLIDFYDLTYEYPLSTHTIKNGNYYYTSAEEGYSSMDGDIEQQIQNFINEKLEYFTPLDIIDELFKFTDCDLSEYLNLDYDYSIAIDFNNLVLEDGIYILTFLYEDLYGNIGEKDFNVILDITEPIEPEPDCLNGETTCDGTNYFICENEEWVYQGQIDGYCGYEFICSSGETDCDGEYYFVCLNNAWISYGKIDGYCGYIEEEQEEENETTYTPTEPEVLEYVNEIGGLLNGTIIQITFEETILEAPILQNSNDLGYLNITTNQNTTGEIYFHILKSKITNKSKIDLYVLEDSWVKLNTEYLGENSLYYEYVAYTPHFSIFMIAEDTYVAPTLNPKHSRRSLSCKTIWECSDWSICLNGFQTRKCEKEKSWCKIIEPKPDELQSCFQQHSTNDVEIITSNKPKETKNFSKIIFLGVLLISIFILIFVLIYDLVEKKTHKK